MCTPYPYHPAHVSRGGLEPANERWTIRNHESPHRCRVDLKKGLRMVSEIRGGRGLVIRSLVMKLFAENMRSNGRIKRPSDRCR